MAEITRETIRDRIIELRRLRPAELADHPLQWRTHPAAQREAIEAILREIGQAGALLAWHSARNGGQLTTWDGHLRKSLDPDLPWPVLVTDLTDAEADYMLTVYDPLSAMAGAEAAKLDAALRTVQSGEAAVQALLNQVATEAGLYAEPGPIVPDDAPEPQLDRAAELQQQWGTTLGQLWEIPSLTLMGQSHRLMCGDSTKVDHVTRVMGDEKAHLFATDPPYGVDYVKIKSGIPGSGYATLDQDYDDITADQFQDKKLQDFLETAFRAWLPYLDRAAWYLWHAHLTQGFFAAAAAAADVLLHRQIIWVKSGFNLTRSGMYHWAHEPCFFGWVRGQQPPWYGEKNQRTIWEIARHEGKGDHPTQKPAGLWFAPIQNHTRLGQICAEPFAGSGSQYLACEHLGRRCYGMEIEPKYVAVTLQRLTDLGLTPRLVEPT